MNFKYLTRVPLRNIILRKHFVIKLDMEKLFIFDCDGVLVDSELIGSRIYAHALTNYGYSLSAEECLRRFTGMSDKTAQEIIFSESGIQIPESLSQMIQEITVEAFEKELQPIIYDFIKTVAQENFQICVASSSPKHRVIRSLELTDQYQFFSPDKIFTSQQVNNGKPAPDLFLLAAEVMGYQPKDCIVIEDSVAGIKAAIAAKMNPIGFLGGSHAKFDWYQSTIRNFDIPIACNTSDLLELCCLNYAKQ